MGKKQEEDAKDEGDDRELCGLQDVGGRQENSLRTVHSNC